MNRHDWCAVLLAGVVGSWSAGCKEESEPSGSCVMLGQVCAGVQQLTLGSGTYHTDGASCASTIYVREGASNGDGSQGAPLADLPDGVAVASPGDCIALAAGSYTGASVPGSVSILGRGAAQTTITGEATALEITAGDDGLYRGVRITGSGVGVVVGAANNLTFESVEVADVFGVGVLVREGRYFTFEQSRIAGVQVLGNDVVGVGLVNLGGPGIVIRNSLIEDCRGTALLARDADLIVESSVLRNNEGYGVAASCQQCGAMVPIITVTDSLIEGNAGVGMWFKDVAPSVTNCVIAGTVRTIDGFSRSVEIVRGEPFVLSDNVIEGGQDMGVFLASARGDAERNLVQDHAGRGIWVQQVVAPAGVFAVNLVDNFVSGNQEVGLGAMGEVVVNVTGGQIDDTETKAIIVDNALVEVGDALQILTSSTVDADGVLFLGSGRAGVLVDGAGSFRIANSEFDDYGELAIVVQNMVSWDPSESVPASNTVLGGGGVSHTEYTNPEDFLGWDPSEIPISWDPSEQTF
ncbi:MAG: right-handed parallel beta-helix repeat-containing protein [bacterium]